MATTAQDQNEPTQPSSVTLLSAAAKNIASAYAVQAAEFDLFEAARYHLRKAYNREMSAVMDAAVRTSSEKEHLKLLGDGERCLAQFQSALDWITRQQEKALAQATARVPV